MGLRGLLASLVVVRSTVLLAFRGLLLIVHVTLTLRVDLLFKVLRKILVWQDALSMTCAVFVVRVCRTRRMAMGILVIGSTGPGAVRASGCRWAFRLLMSRMVLNTVVFRYTAMGRAIG